MTEYPVPPRLNPTGTGYVCDTCNRQWPVGEVSGCAKCAGACELRTENSHIRLTDRTTGAILVMPKAALCLWAYSDTDVRVTPLGLAAYMQKAGEVMNSEPYFVKVKETLSEIEAMLD